MSKVTANISMSLDGYVAGPNAGVGNPLGDGGERVHEWVFGLAAWREQHGLTGGSDGPSNAVVEEATAHWGAIVMGRRMFAEGEAPWGEEPPFRAPVFVLAHEPREPLAREGGTSFTFVTDGIERALEQARAAAGGGDVSVAGGAETIRQFLDAGLLDELTIDIVPIVLGGGIRLFAGIDAERVAFEKARVIDAPGVTHVTLLPVRA